MESGEGSVWAPVCGIAIGAVTTEKWVKYVRLAHEKAQRLTEHPDHVSSFQSRDETAEKWPGAVQVSDEHIVSTSDFAWKFDELVGLLIGRSFGILTDAHLWRLIDTSSNEHAERYFANRVPRPR